MTQTAEVPISLGYDPVLIDTSGGERPLHDLERYLGNHFELVDTVSAGVAHVVFINGMPREDVAQHIDQAAYSNREFVGVAYREQDELLAINATGLDMDSLLFLEEPRYCLPWNITQALRDREIIV